MIIQHCCSKTNVRGADMKKARFPSLSLLFPAVFRQVLLSIIINGRGSFLFFLLFRSGNHDISSIGQRRETLSPIVGKKSQDPGLRVRTRGRTEASGATKIGIFGFGPYCIHPRRPSLARSSPSSSFFHYYSTSFLFHSTLMQAPSPLLPFLFPPPFIRSLVFDTHPLPFSLHSLQTPFRFLKNGSCAADAAAKT